MVTCTSALKIAAYAACINVGSLVRVENRLLHGAV
jgi:hypothetical protein